MLGVELYGASYLGRLVWLDEDAGLHVLDYLRYAADGGGDDWDCLHAGFQENVTKASDLEGNRKASKAFMY